MTDVIQGRDFMLQHSADDGVTWDVVGPVNARGVAISSPVQDVTDQSSDTSQSEFCHTGYQNFTVSVSGNVREKAGTDAGSGLVLMTYKELAAIANAATVNARKGLFRLIDTLESYEDVMLISEWSREGGRSDIQEFSMTLQASGESYAYAQIA